MARGGWHSWRSPHLVCDTANDPRVPNQRAISFGVLRTAPGRSSMKRSATTLLLSLVVLSAFANLASAALRVPQVPVVGGGLQAYLTSVGQTINVNTDQDATQTWSHTVSGTTTYTIEFQSSPNAAIQQFGLYNAAAVIPPLLFLMSGRGG